MRVSDDNNEQAEMQNRSVIVEQISFPRHNRFSAECCLLPVYENLKAAKFANFTAFRQILLQVPLRFGGRIHAFKYGFHQQWQNDGSVGIHFGKLPTIGRTEEFAPADAF